MAKHRVLVIAHGHPELSKGGAEIAAHDMFTELNSRDDVQATLLAATHSKHTAHGGTPFSQIRPNELLFHVDAFDIFKLTQANKRYQWYHFEEMLDAIDPHVVHFHHYFNIGLESMRLIKHHNPETRIVVTLHEFWAICHREGQMLRTNGQLCEGASPAACADCFPKISAQMFFMRDKYIKSFFALVDHFIAPSEFLRQRYIDWGLDPASITVVENGQQPLSDPTPDPVTIEHGSVRLGYFGQIAHLKGLDLLLEALIHLPKSIRRRIELHVHGDNLDRQPVEFQENVRSGLDALGRRALLHGAYSHRDIGSLMSGYDWVVVPSRWWENSPLVIQEAFTAGVPVIASDIGGMAEKVTHGVDGLHFRANDVSSLRAMLTKIVEDRSLQKTCQSGISTPLSIGESTDRILELYGLN